MSDEEFEACINKIFDNGRVWDALRLIDAYIDGLDALDDSDILSGEQEHE